ncbi:acyl-CoA thioesterase [Domibacillus indicus]|uniref:acyl-CoA thioesterase n=1 Tax=Domibacillus indicus TaxID=1437523 RepID=UPI000617AFAC|nr:thioesterase family protein [Domibacillus indicus]
MRVPAYIDNWKNWSESFVYYWPVTVRFSEIDMLGHVNNTEVFKYLEEARIQFLKNKGIKKEWDRDQAVFVVADLQCDYIKQIFYEEQLKVYVRAASSGTSSCDIHYKGENGKKEVVFTGRGTIVQIDKASGRPVPLDENTKQLLTLT